MLSSINRRFHNLMKTRADSNNFKHGHVDESIKLLKQLAGGFANITIQTTISFGSLGLFMNSAYLQETHYLSAISQRHKNTFYLLTVTRTDLEIADIDC